jgi:hypothetical protein
LINLFISYTIRFFMFYLLFRIDFYFLSLILFFFLILYSYTFGWKNLLKWNLWWLHKTAFTFFILFRSLNNKLFLIFTILIFAVIFSSLISWYLLTFPFIIFIFNIYWWYFFTSKNYLLMTFERKVLAAEIFCFILAEILRNVGFF